MAAVLQEPASSSRRAGTCRTARRRELHNDENKPYVRDDNGKHQPQSIRMSRRITEEKFRKYSDLRRVMASTAPCPRHSDAGISACSSPSRRARFLAGGDSVATRNPRDDHSKHRRDLSCRDGSHQARPFFDSDRQERGEHHGRAHRRITLVTLVVHALQKQS